MRYLSYIIYSLFIIGCGIDRSTERIPADVTQILFGIPPNQFSLVDATFYDGKRCSPSSYDANCGTGNGDGIANAGETILLDITVKNTGAVTTKQPWLVVSSNTSGVAKADSLKDGMVLWENILPGATVVTSNHAGIMSRDLIGLKINSSVPVGTTINISIALRNYNTSTTVSENIEYGLITFDLTTVR